MERRPCTLPEMRVEERHHINVSHYHCGERNQRPHLAKAAVVHSVSSFLPGKSCIPHAPAGPANDCIVSSAPSHPFAGSFLVLLLSFLPCLPSREAVAFWTYFLDPNHLLNHHFLKCLFCAKKCINNGK